MNPFYCYCLSFVIALTAYSLKWSNLYPALSGSLLVFLILTILFLGSAGFLWAKKVKIPAIPFQGDVRTAAIVTGLLYMLWTLDFVHAGGVPLLMILSDQPFNYRTFGIPTLHVFTVTFGSFYTILLFHQYLYTRKGWLFGLFVFNLLAGILIYSRAMLLFNACACVLLLLNYHFIHRKKLALIGLPVLIVTFFLFGAMGNLRVAREGGKPYAGDLLVSTGGATEGFISSPIPNEFFWTYIYVTSPLANLQTNAMLLSPPPLSGPNALDLLANEFTFDFISKRLNRISGNEGVQEYRIVGPFNVSTIYSRSYSYLGWWGMTAMAIFLLILPWAYLAVLRSNSPYSATGFAIMGTIFLFSSYDNTFRMTGLGFQLVYPLVMSYLQRKKWFALAPDSASTDSATAT